MKKYFAVLVALFVSVNAFGYSSPAGVDPAVGGYDVETKSAVKSEASSYSDAISKGHALYYSENELTGLYKVSRYYSGAGNDAASVKRAACIAGRDVATGDTATFPCVTKGYVDYALYAAVAAPGAPIAVGDYLCISTQATALGRLVPCASGVTSPFMALEAKTTTGTGTMKISVNSK